MNFRIDRTDGLKRLARPVPTWAIDNEEKLRLSDPDAGDLSNRAADNWRPLLAIADIVGGKWPTLARKIASNINGKDVSLEQPMGVALLSDIRDAFLDRDDDECGSAQLVALLAADHERPWCEWRNNKPITPRQLAIMLSRYGIAPETIRMGDRTMKGYRQSQFADAFARYLSSGRPEPAIDPAQRNTDSNIQGSLHSSIRNGLTTVTDATTRKLNGDGHCHDVTDQSALKGLENAANRASELGPPALGPPGDSLDDFR